MDNANGTIRAVTAAEALVAYRLVNPDGTYSDAITERPLGVVQFDVANAEVASAQVNGITYLDCDGSGTAITVGALLMPKASSDGLGIVAVGATAIPCAEALEATTSATGRIQVQLLRGIPALGA
jgi:hypothetical protein